MLYITLHLVLKQSCSFISIIVIYVMQKCNSTLTQMYMYMIWDHTKSRRTKEIKSVYQGQEKNNHKLKNSRKQDNYIVKQTEYKKGCGCDTKGRGITPGRKREAGEEERRQTKRENKKWKKKREWERGTKRMRNGQKDMTKWFLYGKNGSPRPVLIYILQNTKARNCCVH